MSVFFVFLVGVFLGFFDFFYVVLLVLFLFLAFLKDLGLYYFGGVFFVDSLSFFIVFLCLYLFCFCVFCSFIESFNSNFSSFFFTYLGVIFFFVYLSFVVFSVFIFYVFFEFVFVLMFFFVLNWGYSPERVQASFYMVFYTMVVSFPFLIFMLILSTSMMYLKFMFFGIFEGFWGFFLFFVFLVKLPVYGVHLWLPKAHVESPIVGSMLLAGILLKLGGYGFYRFFSFLVFYLVDCYTYMYSIGLVGGLISCFLCLRQSDLKSFVAYSSVCHMGYALSAMCSMFFFGLSGAVYMLIGHGFCSSCLFYILYLFYERYHSRSIFVIKGCNYLVSYMLFFVFMFSVLNMGVPPSLSFFSEVSIVMSLLSVDFFSMFFGGFLLFFSGLYSIYFYTIISHGSSVLKGVFFSFNVRELSNVYIHLFPLFFMPLCLSLFFVI